MRILTRNDTLEYYIEDTSELANIPQNAPAGTIVQCNANDGFKILMNFKGV